MKTFIALLAATALSAQAPPLINPACLSVSVADGSTVFYPNAVFMTVTSKCAVPYNVSVGLKYMAGGARIAESTDQTTPRFRSLQPGETAYYSGMSDWLDYTTQQPAVTVREVTAW